MDRLTLLLLELVKVNKHFHLLKSAFHPKAAGNTKKDKGRQKEQGGGACRRGRWKHNSKGYKPPPPPPVWSNT